jgi:hypothetical protein
MYTQVTFGHFLERVFANAKASHGIEFDQYPNTAVAWEKGDWLYEITNGFSVRVFRWLSEPKLELAGPDFANARETHEAFEARFEREFFKAIAELNVELE